MILEFLVSVATDVASALAFGGFCAWGFYKLRGGA